MWIHRQSDLRTQRVTEGDGCETMTWKLLITWLNMCKAKQILPGLLGNDCFLHCPQASSLQTGLRQVHYCTVPRQVQYGAGLKQVHFGTGPWQVYYWRTSHGRASSCCLHVKLLFISLLVRKYMCLMYWQVYFTEIMFYHTCMSFK